MCCALLRLIVAALHCKARSPCAVQSLLFLPLFPSAVSEEAVMDAFMVGNKLLV